MWRIGEEGSEGLVNYVAAQLKKYLHVFFNDPATTEFYALSLHDPLPMRNVFHHFLRFPNLVGTPAIASPQVCTTEPPPYLNLVCLPRIHKNTCLRNVSHPLRPPLPPTP